MGHLARFYSRPRALSFRANRGTITKNEVNKQQTPFPGTAPPSLPRCAEGEGG